MGEGERVFAMSREEFALVNCRGCGKLIAANRTAVLLVCEFSFAEIPTPTH